MDKEDDKVSKTTTRSVPPPHGVGLLKNKNKKEKDNKYKSMEREV